MAPTMIESPLARLTRGEIDALGGEFDAIHDVEHHLYPDMPSTRYAEIAGRVKDICERYDLPYNTGPFLKQLAMVQRTILRLALPCGQPRPKPGPYRSPGRGTDGNGSGNGSGVAKRSATAATGSYGSGPEQPTDGVRVAMPGR